MPFLITKITFHPNSNKQCHITKCDPLCKVWSRWPTSIHGRKLTSINSSSMRNIFLEATSREVTWQIIGSCQLWLAEQSSVVALMSLDSLYHDCCLHCQSTQYCNTGILRNFQTTTVDQRPKLEDRWQKPEDQSLKTEARRPKPEDQSPETKAHIYLVFMLWS